MPDPISPQLIRSFIEETEGLYDFQSFENRPIAYATYDLLPYLNQASVLNEHNPDLPEYIPYHLSQKVEPVKNSNYFAQKCIDFKQQLQEIGRAWGRHTYERVKSLFDQNQFDLLVSLGQGQELRVTRYSTAHQPKEEFLYGLSNWSFAQWFGPNAMTQFIYEGLFFARSITANVAKIAELTPRILVGRAKEIQREFKSELEPLLRQAAAVLKDDHYENVEFLESLWSQLNQQLLNYQRSASDLVIDNNKFATTKMKAVQKRFETLFEELKSQSSLWVDESKWYRISDLKVDLSKFFKKGDKYYEAVNEAIETIILSNGHSKCSTTAQRLRENIAHLIQDIDVLKSKTDKKVEEMLSLLSSFEKDRKLRVAL